LPCVSGTINPVPRFKFIVQRLSKVPQLVGQKRALGREIPTISTLLAGTIIAENVPEVPALFFEARLIEQGRVPFNCG
ncbi:MAG TPA: hypothetical protein VFM05_10660, partial [Candidatus Saccharimonadales bacterium]|nr:hypothetical protein [Candidatus Saccharimonadales bacterium]